MNYRSIITTTFAAALTISACGGNDDFLEAGTIDLDEGDASTGGDAASADPGLADDGDPAAGRNENVPGYCSTLASMRVSAGGNLDEALPLYLQLLDGLALEGPDDLREQISGFADDTRALRDIGYDTILKDAGDLTDAESDVVIQFGVATEQFDALAGEITPLFESECGAFGGVYVDPVTGAEVDAGQTAGSGGSTSSGQTADGFVPFDEVVDGPFGAGEFNNTSFAITDVAWANRLPTQYLRTEFQPFEDEADRRFVYLTVDLTNNDPNDAVAVEPEHLALLVDDGKAVAAEEAFSGPPGIGRDLASLTGVTRTFGFDVGEVIDAERLTLRFANDAIPGFIEVRATDSPDPVGYPLSIEPPAPGSYIGSNNFDCGVPWTWSVDEAIVTLDLDADFDGPGRQFNGRARTGTRWLELTGTITAGDEVGNCLVGSGNLNSDDLRLVIDGLPIAPMDAPNTVLDANEGVAVDVVWAIPVDATELAIMGIGRDGDTFQSPFTVPELPAVRGE